MTVVQKYPNFITPEECEELNSWVDEGVKRGWLDKGINSKDLLWGYDLRFTSRGYADRFDSYPDVAYKIFDRITEFLGLEQYPKSVNGGGRDGIVVSCTFPGGEVWNHRDQMEGEQRNLHVLRCNIMTREADAGAELYVNDERIYINQGDLHCYLPSKYWHHVTPAEGTNSRIMWMFGYQISDNDWESRHPVSE